MCSYAGEKDKTQKRHPRRTFYMLSTNLEGTNTSFTLVPLLL